MAVQTGELRMRRLLAKAGTTALDDRHAFARDRLIEDVDSTRGAVACALDGVKEREAVVVATRSSRDDRDRIVRRSCVVAPMALGQPIPSS
jgi:hypothetical protein